MLRLEVVHLPNHSDLHLHYQLSAATVQQLEELVNRKAGSTIRINLDDDNIQSQVRLFSRV
jgi:hypothetical protein